MAGPVALILIPGLLCDRAIWQPQCRALGGAGNVRVSGAQTRHDNLAAMAGEILAEAPPRFALAGLSMGGYLALELLRRAPQRVSHLALLDTSARPDTREQGEMRRLLLQQAAAGHFDAVVAGLVDSFLAAGRPRDERLAARLHAMGLRVGPAAFARQQRAIMERPDARPGLAAVACPTLVLCGSQDRLTPPALSEEIAAAIPGADLRVLDDCGHISTLDRPAAVSRAMAEWLAR